MADLTALIAKPEIQLDLLKLFLQLMAALGIARLTVYWALLRFKSEKVWDRQTTALADVMAALREMQRVKDREFDLEMTKLDVGDEYQKALRERYNTAKKRFEDVAAIAILVLPRDMATVIEALETELRNGRYTSLFDELDDHTFKISETIKRLRSAVSPETRGNWRLP